MAKRSRNVTIDDRKEFLRLHKLGLSDREIGEKTGFHQKTVGNHLIDMIGYRRESADWKAFRLKLEKERKSKNE